MLVIDWIDMSNRNYLEITPQPGMWYVSNLGNLTQDAKTITIGIGALPGKRLSDCIVGGPFDTEEIAKLWCNEHPEHGLGANVWQQKNNS
ncbi:hypothetical protein [Gimesia panareensis]|uniref:hypothetical protein n=1 Tax=Gimesia panareensis TaxID=2527978 RepID=UPI00119DA738|nr:hypothetical protein [Gimesia panareensis]